MSITRGTLACSQESTIHSTSFGHLATRDAEKSPRSKPNLKTSSDIRLTRYPSCLGKSSKGNPRARRSNYGLRQRHLRGQPSGGVHPGPVTNPSFWRVFRRLSEDCS